MGYALVVGEALGLKHARHESKLCHAFALVMGHR